MRIALNFRRIDPTKGGAETYVVDLCRRLDQDAGHEVDGLRRDLPRRREPCPRGVGVRPGRGPRPGPDWPEDLELRQELRAGPESRPRRNYDCTVGLINTWHHDVLIPQGGRPRGEPRRTTPGGSRPGWRRWALHPGQAGQSQGLDLPGDRGPAVRPGPGGPGRGRLEDGPGPPRSTITASRPIGSTSSPTRSTPAAWPCPSPARTRPRVPEPASGLGPTTWSPSSSAITTGSRGSKPLLKALRAAASATRQARPIHLLACGGGRPGPVPGLARQARAGRQGPPPRLPGRHPALLPRRPTSSPCRAITTPARSSSSRPWRAACR